MPNGNEVNSTASLVKSLSLAVGLTGYSGPNNIWDVVAAEIAPHADHVDRDRLGSMIALKSGEQAGNSRHKIMLAAHLDEIGAIVTKIDQGFLRFSPVGGLDMRILMGQDVLVHGRRALPGVIGSIPPHFQVAGAARDTVEPQELFIDVGLPPDDVSQAVQVGDLISFHRTPTSMLDGLVSGKSMDNRASIAAMLVCLQQLQTLRHAWDVYAVATADEEWGSYVGATTQAYAIRPDVAIALDVTFADVDEIDVKLDGGPVISLGVGNHPVVRERLVDICRTLELKWQSEIMPSGAGTDAAAIEVSRAGVPTVLVSIPSRYMHSPIEVISPKDIDRVGRLLAHFIAGLDESFIEALTPAVG